jgi:hypothetical protein
VVRLVSAWIVVNGLLLAPEWIAASLTPDAVAPWLSVEAAVVVAAMALLPERRWTRGLAWLVGAVVVVASVVGFADLVFWSSLGRPLNLSLDLYLLDAVWRLAVGNIGLARAAVGTTLVVLTATALVVLVARLLSPRPVPEWQMLVPGSASTRPFGRVALGLAGCTIVVWLLGLAIDPLGARTRAPAASLARSQAALFLATRAERAAFEVDLAERPSTHAEVPDLLARLDGANVVLSYLESYGMAALEDPELGTFVLPQLDTMAARLEAAGLHVASGRLVSPTLGGQSWYAHGTVLSGLWLSSQQRWELMIRSGRETLVDDFHRAGYRAATIMPAITTPWPEAVQLGYDDVHTRPTIPYAGPPFYWVTMPDQFTWSFVGDVLERAPEPSFVEVGMVSSHAPWTPVLPLLDWDALGNGAAFEPHRLEGHPPEELWWDVAALRAGYAQSMAYSVAAMAQFAERFLDDRTLLVVFGDHQAAPWVTGAEGADVPAHVIARDPALIEPFLAWGFSPGTRPVPGRPVHRMDEFREWFVRAYSGARTESEASTAEPANASDPAER